MNNSADGKTLFGERWDTLYKIGTANQSIRGLTPDVSVV